MQPRRLMICVDEPETLAKTALETGWLARRLDCSLVIYHALTPYHGELQAFQAWARERAERIEQMADAPTFEGIDVTVVTQEDPANLVDGIAATADAMDVDFVVVPTHARRGLNRMVFGSLAERITRSCRVPVLTFDLKRVSVDDEVPFDRIIAPVDFSPPSLAALQRAVALANALECSTVALHVIEVMELYGLDRVPFEGEHRPMIAATEGRLKRIVEGFRPGARHGIDVRCVVGGVVDEVRDLAKQWKNPLIVMSTAGRDSLGDRILGSRTERLIRAAGCSVLSLPAEQVTADSTAIESGS